MIPNLKWFPNWKSSPTWTANGPEWQMIPKSDVDCKLSRRKKRNGMEFGLMFFIYLLYFHYPKDSLEYDTDDAR